MHTDRKVRERNPIAAAALEYARRGIPVFPCWRKNKAPRIEKGFKAATINPTQIKKWWTKWPDAMIGVPTGRKSGIDVLDIDVKKDEYIDGFDFLPNWQKISSVIVRTPRGGAHLYFKSDGKLRNSTDRIAPGIDTRGEGGYVIMPPSRNSADEYTFLDGKLKDPNDLPAFPPDLFAKLQPKYDGPAGVEPEADPERVAAAMAVVSNDDVGWDEWKKFGLAIYRATSGAGFPIFDHWSRKSSKYDEANTRKEWGAIDHSRPDRIGAGTIFYYANQADKDWWKKGDKLILDPKAPVDGAMEFVRRLYCRDDTPCLRYYRGSFYRWSSSNYEECDDHHLRSQLYAFLAQAITVQGKPFNPNAHKVNQVWDALCAVVEVDAKRQAPFFIDDEVENANQILEAAGWKKGADGIRASPTLNGLASQFGLAPLIDKRCAIIRDARLGPRTNAHTVAERLLSISGEDALTIDRKYKDAWTGRLQVRFLILSNELPGIADASGALASRFVLLTLENSFYGKEDLDLADKLIGELPGILNWSLRGLDRLRQRGHFEMPQSSLDAIRLLEDLASPVGAFLRDWCKIGPDKRSRVHLLYDAYTKWCEVEGHKPKSNAWFGRDLRAAIPHVKSRGQGHDRFYEGIDLNEHGQERYEMVERTAKLRM